MLNENEIVVVPMHPGTIILYSGYMLTHGQQIKNLDTLSLPFVNLVAYYNSKRLFSNIIESFQQDIREDNETLSRGNN